MAEIEFLLNPIYALLFFLAVQGIRRFLFRLVVPRLFLQLGLSGHANSVGSLFPRALQDWLRQDFEFRRDFWWLINLALHTTLLSAVPFWGGSGISVQKEPVSLALLLLASNLVATAISLKEKGSTQYEFASRQVLRAMLGAVTLYLVLQAVFFSLGVESLAAISKEVWLIFKSPLMAAIFVCAIFLLPALRVEVPNGGTGVGSAKVLRSLSECFWASLVVSIFLNGGSGPAAIIGLDIAIKSGVVLFVFDLFAGFQPKARQFSEERRLLRAFFPLLVLLMASLTWRRFVG